MDLKKIKEKIADLKTGNDNSKMLWKPKEGMNHIRIVPNIYNKDWPFMEVHFYYGMGKKTLVSPLTYGSFDPIQEFVDKLKNTGDKEDWRNGNSIQAKMRTYVPIIERGKEDEGVKLWGFGKQVYEEILKTLDDPEYGDITDLKSGRDLKVEYIKGDGAKVFAKTNCRVSVNQSPATKDPAVVQKIKEMPKIEDIFPANTVDELNAALERFINNAEETEVKEEPTAKAEVADLDFDDLPFDKPEQVEKPKKETKGSKKNDLVASSKEDMDDAFDDLFGNS